VWKFFSNLGGKEERKKERRRSWVLWRVILVTFYVTEEFAVHFAEGENSIQIWC
jgi:hypothetical protein